MKVLYRLRSAGYEGYLVGGGVRDLLLGREPKDFDVATNARPEEIRQTFRNCRLIGRRFRLAHVRFGREIIEVATFRAAQAVDADADDMLLENGRLVRDNVYGTLEDDAWRRDFSINALYYNIEDFSVVDYTGGMEDLWAGRLRLIGHPEQRYREDPVRMLRAIRFGAKLGFRIDAATEAPIRSLAPLLADVPPSRLFEEILKVFMGGYALQGFEQMRRYQLFEHLFPMTDACLASGDIRVLDFISQALKDTDTRVAEGLPVTPAFLFAALLWEPVRRRADEHRGAGMSDIEAMQTAGDEIVAGLLQTVMLPKRFSLPMREIWTLQPRLAQRRGKRAQRLVAHPRFRAGYDFLKLRARSGEPVEELVESWTQIQADVAPSPTGSGSDQVTKAEQPPGGRRRGGRRRRSRRGGGRGT